MTADDVVAVDSPLFLLMSPTPCWKCNADNLVIALASKRVRCSDPYANEGDVPILLSNIEKMPKEIREKVKPMLEQMAPAKNRGASSEEENSEESSSLLEQKAPPAPLRKEAF